MRSKRFAAFGAVALLPASALLLTGSTPAGASTYSQCVANVENQVRDACNALKRVNPNAHCSGVASQTDILNRCGPPCPSGAGELRPKFVVVSVIYAPPGSANKGSSTVDYGTGSTTGVTTTVKSSFKSQFSSTASTQIGPKTDGIGFDVTASASHTADASSQLDIKKKDSEDIQVPGPTTDGIDHSQDEIWVLLAPVVTIDGSCNDATWGLGADANTLPQYAKVQWLQNPSSMPTNVAQTFAAHGFTPADFATMLARDPMVPRPGPAGQIRAPQPPDPSRYVLQQFQTYEPDPNGPQQNWSLSSDTTNTSSSTFTDEYSLGISGTESAGLTSWLSVSLKASQTWTWSHSSTNSNSIDYSQTATGKIISPSAGYTGPTDIAVYLDTVYRTFLFVPVGAGGAPQLTGLITGADGQPVAAAEVVVTAGGQRVHAFTNAKGVYRAFALPSGSAQVSVGGASQQVNLGSGTANADFKLGPARPPPIRPVPRSPRPSAAR